MSNRLTNRGTIFGIFGAIIMFSAFLPTDKISPPIMIIASGFFWIVTTLFNIAGQLYEMNDKMQKLKEA